MSTNILRLKLTTFQAIYVNILATAKLTVWK